MTGLFTNTSKRSDSSQRLVQQGFSMVEVLVTLLIVTLSLFGAAGMQAYSMRVNQVGKFRGQAVSLVNDLAERMEANFISAGQYAVTATGTAPALGQSCDAAGCTSAQLVTFDLNSWQNAVANTLPQSSWEVISAPTVVGSSLIATTYTLSWQERASTAQNSTSTATVTATYVATRLIKNTP